MSDLARYLAGDNYLTRSASGLKRGLSALADSLVARSNEGAENMQAALSGVRVKPGAILTDAGYVMPDASGQADFSQVGLEREPDVLRAMELFGNIMGPVKGVGIAAKSGTGGKVAADVAHALPMDEASRMARAAEMGFDTGRTVYHGTDASFSEFRPSDRGAFGPGVYFSELPSVAGAYGGKVDPYFTRGKLFDAMPGWESRVNAEKASALIDAMPEHHWKSAAQAKLADRGSLTGEDLWQYMMAGAGKEKAQRILQDNGYSGVRGLADGQETVVFDPRNIRSVSAAFDPSKADSADLLASRANLGPIVNALLQGYDRQ